MSIDRRGSILGAVDIGTNSVKLLVVRVKPRGGFATLRQWVVITRIGEGLARTGRLSQAAVARTLEQLGSFAAEARRLGAIRVRAVATAALRDAPEGESFIRALTARTGWDVRTITGRREAGLGFLGASLGLTGRARRAVFDVGGGSAQVSLGAPGKIDWSRSLALGAVRLTERFVTRNPVPAEEVARIRDHVRRALAPVAARADGAAVIGIGGTVACVTMLERARRGEPASPADLQGVSMTRAAVTRWIDELARRTVAERKALPTMDPGRADVIVGGAIAVEGILAALGARTFRVSTRGIRFGLIAEMSRAPDFRATRSR